MTWSNDPYAASMHRDAVSGIPAEISRPLPAALLLCDEFSDSHALRQVLAHEKLSPWRYSISFTDNPRSQVDAVVAHLVDQYCADGENALVLFLRLLADRYSAADERHGRLLSLAVRLAEAKGGPSPEAPPITGSGEKGHLTGAPAAPRKIYGEGVGWAVLVGINDYRSTGYPTLHVCVNDAVAIRDGLCAGGFEADRMLLLTDREPASPSRADIYDALASAARAAAEDDRLFFYFSGHGDVCNGASYLVPRDGRAASLRHTGVALDDVVEIMQGSAARARILVLDACHSGADFQGKGPRRMSPDFIKWTFEQARGEAILASCEQGQLSQEWREKERSVFTHFFLEALGGAADRDEKGFVTVQDVHRHVSHSVRVWAFANHFAQTPTLQSTTEGDIILAQVGVK